MQSNTKPNAVRSEEPRHKGGDGFTLIELLIVVVILAVAAAIVVPMASSAGTLQLRAAVNMVAADLEYAKSQSIGTGQRYCVVFDAAGETYQITDAGGTTIPHPVKKGFPYLVSFANDGRLGQVDIVSADFDATSAVSFDYLGSPLNSSGAGLNSGVVTLRAGGATRTVTVAPVTGFISISN
jgi:general secretion pathway protein H